MQSIYVIVIKNILCSVILWSQLLDATATYRVRLSSSWYPANRFELATALTKHERNAFGKYEAHLNVEGVKAIIVPHAGYAYSGDVAAAAYRLLSPDYFKRIIIIGPSHHASFTGVALPHKQYELYKNVLGHIDLDRSIMHRLANHHLFIYHSVAHEAEHAINVQLPFIQKFCGSRCKIVPLLVGKVSLSQIKEIASELKQYIDERTLVIISSDFTHYGSRFNYTPFTNNVTQKIFELDTQVIQRVQNHNLLGFCNILQDTGSTVCGAGPIKILLSLIEQAVFGDVQSHVVAYDTSASNQKNPDHSVSYLSLVVSGEKVEDLPYQYQLTGYEKGVLLKLARHCLQNVFINNVNHDIQIPGLLTNTLRRKQGAFVTLYRLDKEGNRHLRGCIGTMSETETLYKVVHSMTKSAALHDSRFSPVTQAELPYLEISISALTPQQLIASYDDIQLGHDGVTLQYGQKSAVYLPKVAIEQHWDLEQMLSSLSEKAGLDKNAWKLPDAKFHIFQSIDFSENIDPLAIMYEGYK